MKYNRTTTPSKQKLRPRAASTNAPRGMSGSKTTTTRHHMRPRLGQPGSGTRGPSSRANTLAANVRRSAKLPQNTASLVGMGVHDALDDIEAKYSESDDDNPRSHRKPSEPQPPGRERSGRQGGIDRKTSFDPPVDETLPHPLPTPSIRHPKVADSVVIEVASEDLNSVDPTHPSFRNEGFGHAQLNASIAGESAAWDAFKEANPTCILGPTYSSPHTFGKKSDIYYSYGFMYGSDYHLSANGGNPIVINMRDFLSAGQRQALLPTANFGCFSAYEPVTGRPHFFSTAAYTETYQTSGSLHCVVENIHDEIVYYDNALLSPLVHAALRLNYATNDPSRPIGVDQLLYLLASFPSLVPPDNGVYGIRHITLAISVASNVRTTMITTLENRDHIALSEHLRSGKRGAVPIYWTWQKFLYLFIISTLAASFPVWPSESLPPSLEFTLLLIIGAMFHLVPEGFKDYRVYQGLVITVTPLTTIVLFAPTLLLTLPIEDMTPIYLVRIVFDLWLSSLIACVLIVYLYYWYTMDHSLYPARNTLGNSYFDISYEHLGLRPLAANCKTTKIVVVERQEGKTSPCEVEVGPTFGPPPRLPAKTQMNLLIAATRRGCQTTVTDPDVIPHVRRAILNMDLEVVEPSLHDFLSHQPAPKRTMYLTELTNSATGSSKSANRAVISKIFIKREFSPDTYGKLKAPRCIYPQDVATNLSLGPFMMAYSKFLQRRWSPTHSITYASGMLPEQIGDWWMSIMQHPDDFSVYEMDMSQFDSTITVDCLHLEQEIYMGCGSRSCSTYDGRTVDQVLSLNRTRKLKNQGIKIEVEGTRGSGEMNTSCGNTSLNGLGFSAHFLRVHNLSPSQSDANFVKRDGSPWYRVIVMGDDSLLASNIAFEPTTHSMMGFIPKMILRAVLPHANLPGGKWSPDAEFCSGYFLPVRTTTSTSLFRYILVPKPGREMSKMGYVFDKNQFIGPSTFAPACRDYNYQYGLSLLNRCVGLPIMRAIGSLMASVEGVPNKYDFSDLLGNPHGLKTGRIPYEPSVETWEFFEHRYALTQEQLLADELVLASARPLKIPENHSVRQSRTQFHELRSVVRMIQVDAADSLFYESGLNTSVSVRPVHATNNSASPYVFNVQTQTPVPIDPRLTMDYAEPQATFDSVGSSSIPVVRYGPPTAATLSSVSATTQLPPTIVDYGFGGIEMPTVPSLFNTQLDVPTFVSQPSIDVPFSNEYDYNVRLDSIVEMATNDPDEDDGSLANETTLLLPDESKRSSRVTNNYIAPALVTLGTNTPSQAEMIRLHGFRYTTPASNILTNLMGSSDEFAFMLSILIQFICQLPILFDPSSWVMCLPFMAITFLKAIEIYYIGSPYLSIFPFVDVIWDLYLLYYNRMHSRIFPTSTGSLPVNLVEPVSLQVESKMDAADDISIVLEPSQILGRTTVHTSKFAPCNHVNTAMTILTICAVLATARPVYQTIPETYEPTIGLSSVPACQYDNDCPWEVSLGAGETLHTVVKFARTWASDCKVQLFMTSNNKTHYLDNINYSATAPLNGQRAQLRVAKRQSSSRRLSIRRHPDTRVKRQPLHPLVEVLTPSMKSNPLPKQKRTPKSRGVSKSLSRDVNNIIDIEPKIAQLVADGEKKLVKLSSDVINTISGMLPGSLVEEKSRRRGTRESPSVSGMMVNSMGGSGKTMMARSSPDFEFENSELLMQQYTSINFNASQVDNINPANIEVFAWGCKIATAFQDFDLLSLCLEYIPQVTNFSATQASGALQAGWVLNQEMDLPGSYQDADATDLAPFSPFTHCKFPLDIKTCARGKGPYFVSSNPLAHVGDDINFYCPAKFFICTSGFYADDTAIGTWRIHYRFRFHKKNITNPLGWEYLMNWPTTLTTADVGRYSLTETDWLNPGVHASSRMTAVNGNLDSSLPVAIVPSTGGSLGNITNPQCWYVIFDSSKHRGQLMHVVVSLPLDYLTSTVASNSVVVTMNHNGNSVDLPYWTCLTRTGATNGTIVRSTTVINADVAISCSGYLYIGNANSIDLKFGVTNEATMSLLSDVGRVYICVRPVPVFTPNTSVTIKALDDTKLEKKEAPTQTKSTLSKLEKTPTIQKLQLDDYLSSGSSSPTTERDYQLAINTSRSVTRR